jgi:hypothetical protein
LLSSNALLPYHPCNGHLQKDCTNLQRIMRRAIPQRNTLLLQPLTSRRTRR